MALRSKQMTVFPSWSCILLLLVKTVKQYLQDSAQCDTILMQHAKKKKIRPVLYTTAQPSGSRI